MGEVVNVLVAFAVIVFVFRWATSGKDSSADGQSPAAILGFRPKTVTQEQVDAIRAMFPDIPADNIRYDLLRTGSVQLTSNKILERGFLPAPPPPYYRVYPRAIPNDPQQQAAQNANQAAAPASTASSSKTSENLITRFHLEDRLSTSGDSTASEPEHKWEEDPSKRQAMLRERKARMVLAARERMLAQQKQQATTS
ncbi:CUE domain-containing protein [Phanerochaete sordida]|uniref:CUE domain-containing protein n=1 Tax=Phanerochaete sordida TaxID=48140 RepID=A0A9P3GHY9_9APHY|nr:CUE domain-containing protein [Phanerochaete sordida]